MDNFYEQLVTTYKTGMYKLLNACFYIFGVIAIISMTVIPISILCLLIAAACFLGKKKFYVEYEYIFTNGEIDIDKIIEMKKRKKIINLQIKEVELLALEDSYYVKDLSNKPTNIISCYPSTTDKKIYVAIINAGSRRTILKFAPDDEFLDLCFKYNPRAVKKN